MPGRGWSSTPVQPSAQKRRCCPETRAKETSLLPGRRGPRRRPASAGRAERAAQWRRRSSYGTPGCDRRPSGRQANRRFFARGVRSLDQTIRQAKLAAQRSFLTSHLSIVALVVESCQMKNSMQHKNFDLLSWGVPELRSIARCDVSTNRDIACRQRFRRIGANGGWKRRGKRKHVRRFIVPAEIAVQRPHSFTVADQHVHTSAQTCRPSCPNDEPCERIFAQAWHFFLQNHQLRRRSITPEALNWQVRFVPHWPRTRDFL